VKKKSPEAKQADAVWTPWEQDLRREMEAGRAVVVNIKTDHGLIAWAKGQGLYQDVSRRFQWGNPFELGVDGDRPTVIRLFVEHYLPFKPGLLRLAAALKGKALGCWCAPERCHAEWWAAAANGEPWPALP
jgi:hypothetical protein